MTNEERLLDIIKSCPVELCYFESERDYDLYWKKILQHLAAACESAVKVERDVWMEAIQYVKKYHKHLKGHNTMERLAWVSGCESVYSRVANRIKDIEEEANVR